MSKDIGDKDTGVGDKAEDTGDNIKDAEDRTVAALVCLI